MKKILRFTALTAALFLVGFLVPDHSYSLIGTNAGETPKEFVLEDLNGSMISISNYAGNRPVIIVFWELSMSTAFLDYSLDVLRFLNTQYNTFHESRGLEIFGIYTPEEEKDIPGSELEKVRDLVAVNRIKFPILIDKGFRVFREYGVIALPTTIMVGTAGDISFIYPSFPMAAQPLFEERIQDLVGIERVDVHKSSRLKGSVSHSLRLYKYALQMYKKGLLEQALSPLKKSLELDDNFPQAHNLMGVVLWKSGNIEGSKKAFLSAISLHKDNAPANFNYALLLYESGNYAESEQYFKKAISIDSEMAEPFYVLGMLYKRAGREDEALASLGTALGLFEKNRQASSFEIFSPAAYHRISTLYELSELYHKLGEEGRAFEMLRKAAEIVLGLEAVSGKEHVMSRELMIHE